MGRKGDLFAVQDATEPRPLFTDDTNNNRIIGDYDDREAYTRVSLFAD